MITIGIPFFNAEDFLADAILSVQNQSFQEWELLLLDDGSTDDSLKIAKEFERKDSRIRVIFDGENRRLPNRLNQIVREAKFSYIARMDADDIMHKERLKFQLIYLQKNLQIDIVATSMYSIDIKNNITGKRIIVDEVNRESLLRGNYQIIHPSILVRKEWYLRNQYDPLSERAEDYELWLRAILNDDLKITVLSEPLFFYREFGNLTKEKLLLSYRTTNFIFNKFKHKISSSLLFKSKVVNVCKIILVNFIFYIGKENFLVKRRNTELNTEELRLANNSILEALKLND